MHTLSKTEQPQQLQRKSPISSCSPQINTNQTQNADLCPTDPRTGAGLRRRSITETSKFYTAFAVAINPASFKPLLHFGFETALHKWLYLHPQRLKPCDREAPVANRLWVAPSRESGSWLWHTEQRIAALAQPTIGCVGECRKTFVNAPSANHRRSADRCLRRNDTRILKDCPQCQGLSTDIDERIQISTAYRTHIGQINHSHTAPSSSNHQTHNLSLNCIGLCWDETTGPFRACVPR